MDIVIMTMTINVASGVTILVVTASIATNFIPLSFGAHLYRQAASSFS